MSGDGSLSFDRKDYTFVGIMPAGFKFPFGRSAPFWIPLVSEGDSRWQARRSVSPIVPRLGQAAVDPAVLAFTIGISILTGLLFGTMPALRAVNTRANQGLKDGWTRSSITRQRRRLQGSLVVLQIALCLILLVGVTLLIRSLIALHNMNLGFQPKNVMTAHIDLPRAKYPDGQRCLAFYDELLDRVRRLPHVRAAALVRGYLQLGAAEADVSFSVPGVPQPQGKEPPMAKWACISSGFFQAMGIQILKGRNLTDQDGANHIIIDEILSRQYFHDDDPVGRILLMEGMELSIVSVAQATRDFLTPNPSEGTLYMRMDASVQDMILLARTDDDLVRLAPLVRQQVTALSREEVVTRMETLESTLSGMLAVRRFVMILLGLFAALALIVAMIGVYGLLQYSTVLQTHDIGIRMALGARHVDVLTAVLGQGLKLIVIGVAVGIAGALALMRVLSSLLYDVTPTDPVTLIVVACVLMVIALLASYIPARRAAKIDPMEALRYE